MLVTSNGRIENFEDYAMRALLDCIKEGIISVQRIQEANERIDKFFDTYVRPASSDPDSVRLLGTEPHGVPTDPIPEYPQYPQFPRPSSRMMRHHGWRRPGLR
uniref:Uncharacterized protein n=1 Tax=Eutreptiella gymnastica TaxID=73025 RepID=A0A7S4FN33_9EUGL